MTLRDLGGVFSRQFLTAYFLPALVALVGGVLVVAPELKPKAGEDPRLLTSVALLTVVAVLVGLVLLGLRRPVLRVFEGYPLVQLRRRYGKESRLPRHLRPTYYAYRIYNWRIRRQKARRAVLQKAARARPAKRALQGKRELERNFGSVELPLLPTRFGNILRAFEQHADSRWGLSGLTVWPRIAPLLSEREREYHLDAETDVMFVLNLCVVSVALSAVFAVHAAGDGRLTVEDAIGVAPLPVAWALYRLTLVAAVSWGIEVRASVDLHRLELYQQLGVRMPHSFSDERRMADAVSRCLEFGEPMPDRLWGPQTWPD